MDIFDKIQTLPPDVALFVASLFVMFFVGGFGCILLWIIAKHGKVLEKKDARRLRHKKWWEEIQ